MTTTTSRRAKRARKAAANDDALIRHCVALAQCVTAREAGFEADPDGDNKYAAHASTPLDRRGSAALDYIVNTRAMTWAGLQSKARVVPFVIQDFGGRMGCMTEEAEQFFLTLSKEVKEFLQPIVDCDVILVPPDRVMVVPKGLPPHHTASAGKAVQP